MPEINIKAKLTPSKFSAFKGAKLDACPFCLSNGNGSAMIKEAGTKYQCLDCGKYWEDSAIGKPYSLELERGEAWQRETKSRQLKEGLGGF